jgi:DNA-binding CsgD family transcriptional regulator
LSIKTVETYRARLKRKLGIKNRTHLIAFAISRNIERGGTLSARSPQ